MIVGTTHNIYKHHVDVVAEMLRLLLHLVYMRYDNMMSKHKYQQPT